MTTCPFCGGDPFHRTDLGEPVAVVCCDLGDLYFRGKRPAPDEVTLSWGDFHDIATEITRLRSDRDSAASTLEAAEKALEPFAAMATDIESAHAGSDLLDESTIPLPLGDLRLARSVYQKIKGEG